MTRMKCSGCGRLKDLDELIFIGPGCKNKYCFNCVSFNKNLVEAGYSKYSNLKKDIDKYGLVDYTIQKYAGANGILKDEICFEVPTNKDDILFFKELARQRKLVFKNFKEKEKKGLYNIDSDIKVESDDQ
jgi:hypothetical protein